MQLAFCTLSYHQKCSMPHGVAKKNGMGILLRKKAVLEKEGVEKGEVEVGNSCPGETSQEAVAI